MKLSKNLSPSFYSHLQQCGATTYIFGIWRRNSRTQKNACARFSDHKRIQLCLAANVFFSYCCYYIWLLLLLSFYYARGLLSRLTFARRVCLLLFVVCECVDFFGYAIELNEKRFYRSERFK